MGVHHRGQDLAPLLGRVWDASDHRRVITDLIGLGWSLSGVGDWAVGLRSPNGLLAARVCPFDPAYAAFVELCRRCPGHPFLPRMDLVAALDGGGSLTVMEFLTPAKEQDAAEVARRWREGRDDEGDLAGLRREALAVDAEYRARMPWWDGIDLNPGNVRQAADGRLAVIDVFCMDGEALYAQILRDASVVRDRIPEEGLRHVLDIPYIARECGPEEIEALRRAWSAVR
ncbi:hypothetical protein [Streptosporangium sp. KLBMP 9127]|nr:hypothetical protein [Streptosporangium sp. KLBMP 9127]